jgi:hypothetical protein
MIGYISEIDKTFNDITLSAAMVVLMAGCAFGWVYGIFHLLPDWFMRGFMVTLVYVTVYSLAAYFNITFTASVMAGAVVLFAWSAIQYAENGLIFLGFMSLLAIISMAIRKNIAANILIVIAIVPAVILTLVYFKKLTNAIRMLIGSILFSWVGVYCGLYFKTNHENGWVNSLKELYDLVACMHTRECLTHVIASLALVVLRLVISLYFYKQIEREAKARDELLNEIVEHHKQAKKTATDDPASYSTITTAEHKKEEDDEELDAETAATIQELELVRTVDNDNNKPARTNTADYANM